MSDHGDLALRTAALHTEVQQLRAKLTWVDDTDVRNIEDSNPGAAWLLSLCFGGGGQIYNGDTLRGVMLILASFGALIGVGLHGALTLVWLAVNIGSSAHAFMQARAVNRYLAARAELQRHSAAQQAPHAAYQLASAMIGAGVGAGGAAAVPPAQAAPTGPVADLKSRLEKLAILHASGVISELEHRERRLDMLSEWTNLSNDTVDELLFELLPLIRSGMLTQEDVDFIKSLGGRR